METELKNTVAGLLLHSQLALSGSEVSAPVAEKLRVVADLAGNLRQQLHRRWPCLNLIEHERYRRPAHRLP
jgi:hypothetical protein